MYIYVLVWTLRENKDMRAPLTHIQYIVAHSQHTIWHKPSQFTGTVLWNECALPSTASFRLECGCRHMFWVCSLGLCCVRVAVRGGDGANNNIVHRMCWGVSVCLCVLTTWRRFALKGVKDVGALHTDTGAALNDSRRMLASATSAAE